MITSPWRRALCWHGLGRWSGWRPVRCESATIDGEEMLVCRWCYAIKGSGICVIEETDSKEGEL
jgi:hypothetical protein